MKRLFYGKLLIKLIFVLSLFLLALNSSLQAATSPDAIGFRVMPNPDHLSPLRWYQENIKLKGSPQALTVDGYEAVRDGRTVYVNAANIDLSNKHCSNNQFQTCTRDSDCISPPPLPPPLPSALNFRSALAFALALRPALAVELPSPSIRIACVPSFYSNIYIISYNQQAEDATVDIFGQILSHWKFNANITDQDQKAKIIRDTKRLADLADIKLALKNYQAGHNSAYPELAAGSYLAGKSISAWPSWRATLSKDLALTLPLDPINKLGACQADCCKTRSCQTGSDDEKSCGYDPATCWNQTEKKFADPSANTEFNLPAGSRAYVYQYNANGSYNLCALMESGYLTTLEGACPDSGVGHTGPGPQSPITINCGQLAGYEGLPFTGYVSATYTGSGALTWEILTGSSLDDWGPMTIQKVAAVPKQAKLSAGSVGDAGGNYSVNIKVTSSSGLSDSKPCTITIGKCGDGLINGAETCDSNRTDQPCVPPAGQSNCSYCDLNCHLQTAVPVCGDNEKTGLEVCDNGPTSTTRTQICSTRISPTTYCQNIYVSGTQTCNSNCTWDTCQPNPTTGATSGDCSPLGSQPLTNYVCCEIISCDSDTCNCCGRLNLPIPSGSKSGWCHPEGSAVGSCSDFDPNYITAPGTLLPNPPYPANPPTYYPLNAPYLGAFPPLLLVGSYPSFSVGYTEIATQKFSPKCVRTGSLILPYDIDNLMLSGSACSNYFYPYNSASTTEDTQCNNIKTANPYANSAYYPAYTWLNNNAKESCRLVRGNGSPTPANDWKVLTNHSWASYRCWR